MAVQNGDIARALTEDARGRINLALRAERDALRAARAHPDIIDALATLGEHLLAAQRHIDELRKLQEQNNPRRQAALLREARKREGEA